jgi:hypothetical protein
MSVYSYLFLTLCSLFFVDMECLQPRMLHSGTLNATLSFSAATISFMQRFLTYNMYARVSPSPSVSKNVNGRDVVTGHG